MNGQGMYIFANGERYEGLFKNSKKECEGKYLFLNGDIY